MSLQTLTEGIDINNMDWQSVHSTKRVLSLFPLSSDVTTTETLRWTQCGFSGNSRQLLDLDMLMRSCFYF